MMHAYISSMHACHNHFKRYKFSQLAHITTSKPPVIYCLLYVPAVIYNSHWSASSYFELHMVPLAVDGIVPQDMFHFTGIIILHDLQKIIIEYSTCIA